MDSKQDEPKIQPSLHLKLPDLFWSRVPSLDTRAHFVLDSAREGANFKKTVSLTVHNESFSTEELLINGKELPFVREGDVIELVPLDGKADGSRVALVKQSSLSSLKGVQCISISKQLADLFAVKPREEATVQLIRPDQVRTSIVTLSFRDQFLSRSDLFRLQGLLVGQCLYQGQSLFIDGMRLRVKEICDEREGYVERRKCGVVFPSSRLAFRSNSARVFWLLEVSLELSFFNSSGMIMIEQTIDNFVRSVLERWQILKVTHSLVGLFFARVYFVPTNYLSNKEESSRWNVFEGVQLFLEAMKVKKEDSKKFAKFKKDYYDNCIDSETLQDWTQLVPRLKAHFVRFIGAMYLDAKMEAEKWSSVHYGEKVVPVISVSENSNILEAINLALNVCERHYIDRDLSRMGQDIVVLSPGRGVYMVPNYLLDLSHVRVGDFGVGCDLICFNTPPLHSAPLFIRQEGGEEGSVYRPAWMHISYFGEKLPFEALAGENGTTRRWSAEGRPLPFNFFCSHNDTGGKLSKLMCPDELESMVPGGDCSQYDKSIFSSADDCTGVQKSSSVPAKICFSRTSGTKSESLLQVTSLLKKSLDVEHVTEQFTMGRPTLQMSRPGAESTFVDSGVRKNERFKSHARPNADVRTPIHKEQQFTRDGIVSKYFKESPQEDKAVHGCTEVHRRWAHLFPFRMMVFREANDEPNWTSLCEPAILPLTQDFWPSNQMADSVRNQYSLIPDANDYGSYLQQRFLASKESTKLLDVSRGLLFDMICQRLSHDFQFIYVPEESMDVSLVEAVLKCGNHSHAPQSGKEDSSSLISDHPLRSVSEACVRMVLGNEFHELKMVGRDITVDRHVYTKSGDRGGDPAQAQSKDVGKARPAGRKLEYEYSLWHPTSQSFSKMRKEFFHSKEELNWNSVDQALLDVVDHGDVQHRRIRLVLRPHVQGCKFGETVTNFFDASFGEKDTIRADFVDESNPEFCESNLKSRIVIVDWSKAAFGVEWFVIRYYNKVFARSVFAFELQWLSSSGSVMDEVVKLFQRKAKHFGLGLDKVPVELSGNALRAHSIVNKTDVWRVRQFMMNVRIFVCVFCFC
uniref:Uncharacterized protein n=1 Tax=Palpitomonas bilix TaxID=652834 RepID=A0A7S3D6D7_9EUKA|mmetsp:Transcript_24001/g.60788  ORF Transcript_24001/g.60788 Transcript_24001/m.60788 type:complete len:1084 (+) Transcript_24001:177-3428(+)